MNDDGDFRREVEQLREEVDALRSRLEALEGSADDGEQDWASQSPSESAGPKGTAESAASSADTEEAAGIDEGGDREAKTSDLDTSHEAEVDPTSEATTNADRDEPSNGVSDWELEIGVRWLGFAGALALVVGTVFFARLAIERGMLDPLGRVTVGTVVGLLLLGGGRHAATRQGYVRWGRIAAGTGLAVAYFSCYAAYGFESYREAIGTPLWAALGGLTLLVGVTAILSIRDDAPLVAGEAFLLGYAIPFLSTEAATLVLTPVYAAVLAGGLVAIATVKPWSRLVVTSTVATYGVIWLWIADLEPSSPGIGGVTIVVFLTYLFGGHVLRRTARTDERGYRLQLLVLTAVNAVFAAFLLERAVRGVGSAAAAGLGTIVVAFALAGTYAITDRWSVRRDDAAAVGSVVFLAGGVAMAVGPFPTTVGTLAIVAGAVVLSRVAVAPTFRIGAHGVAAALVFKLFAVDATELSAFDAADPMATLTGRPVAFGLAITVFYALAWWLSVEESSLTDVERGNGDRPSIGSTYIAAGTALTVSVLTLELSGVSVSIAWALFGVALLGTGLATARRVLRMLGIAVLGLTTAKVFLFDTSGLDTVARTLSFLVLGAVLLTVSYIYARTRGDTALGLGMRDSGEQ